MLCGVTEDFALTWAYNYFPSSLSSHWHRFPPAAFLFIEHAKCRHCIGGLYGIPHTNSKRLFHYPVRVCLGLLPGTSHHCGYAAQTKGELCQC